MTCNKKIKETLERLFAGIKLSNLWREELLLQRLTPPQTPLPLSHDSLSPYLIFQNPTLSYSSYYFSYSYSCFFSISSLFIILSPISPPSFSPISFFYSSPFSTSSFSNNPSTLKGKVAVTWHWSRIHLLLTQPSFNIFFFLASRNYTSAFALCDKLYQPAPVHSSEKLHTWPHLFSCLKEWNYCAHMINCLFYCLIFAYSMLSGTQQWQQIPTLPEIHICA